MQLPSRWRKPRTAAALALLILLSGCSAFSLAWNYVDGVLVDRVDDWVALEPDQRQRLEQRLQPWLERAALERLPEYSAFLREAAQRVRGGIERPDGRWAYSRVRTLYQDLRADAIESWVAPALTGLDDRQIAHLTARMQSKNDEYRARYIEVTRRNSRRALASRIIEVVEGWTGPLNVNQTQLMYRGTRTLPDTSLDWYRYRLRKQAGFVELLRANPDADAIADYLIGWWQERRGLEPAQRKSFEDFRLQLVDLLTDLTLSLSPLQRASVDRRLRGIAEELDAIEQKVRAGE